MKKILSILLVLTMVFSLAACGDKTETPDETKKTTKAPDDKKDPADDKKDDMPSTFASEEPLELSIHMHFRNAYVYKDEWSVFQKAAELTNVTLKGVAPASATNTMEVFNLLMVGGDLPDIVEGNKLRDSFIKYGMEGAFIPLEDLIKDHAPNLQKFLDDHPYVQTYASGPDGHMYFIPYIPDGSVGKGYYIRKDWLDAVGKEVPTNVDELYEVLTAFKNGDPNGNGEDDEIGFFSRHVQDRFEDNEAVRLVHFWGGRTLYYVEDGVVKHGYTQPEFREGIKNVAKWYAEGLIDPEIYTRGGKARDIALGNNIGGMTHDWFGSSASYNGKLAGEIEGFEFIPIAPPADVNGRVWEEYNRALVKPDGWAITYANEHAIETIKYFDFWFTEEGRRLMNFGVEGEQYDMVEGSPVFKDEVLNGDKSVQAQLWEIGSQVPIGFFQDFAYEIQTYNEIAAGGVQMYVDEEYVEPAFPLLAFTDEEQKVYDEVRVNVETYMKEMHQKWILGNGDVEEEWDDYLARLEELRYQDLLAVYQAAYDRMK